MNTMKASGVSSTNTFTVAGIGPVELTLEDRGEGQPFLVLHGGAGPQSVASFSQLLAEKGRNRVLTPTHPGFGGTPRPDELNSVAGLAALYGVLLDDLGLEDVTVIGNSVGGWIAAEMALSGSPVSAAPYSSTRWVSEWKNTRSPTSRVARYLRSRHSHSTIRLRSVSIPPT